MYDLNDRWTTYNMETAQHTVVAPFEEAVKSIREHINAVYERNQYLEEENKELKSTSFTDKRIAELQEQINKLEDKLSRGFSITKEEEEQVQAWMKEHSAKEHNNPSNYHGAIGGGYSYIFMPTSIGLIWSCRCDACYKKALSSSNPNDYLKSHNGEIIFDDI